MAHDIMESPNGLIHDLAVIDRDGDRVEISREAEGYLYVNSTEGAYIQGEDLFALREFLTELPEEAFVRPADPIEIPDWEEGDCILRQYPSLEGRAYFLQRDDEQWRILGLGANDNWRATDREINATLATPDRIDRPKHTVLRRGGRRVD